jgi:hypothetical protein
MDDLHFSYITKLENKTPGKPLPLNGKFKVQTGGSFQIRFIFTSGQISVIDQSITMYV